MAITPIIYTLEGRDGPDSTWADWSSDDYKEAVHVAKENNLRVIENTYVWEDSNEIDDFTVCPDCAGAHDVGDECPAEETED